MTTPSDTAGLVARLEDAREWLQTLHPLHPRPSHLEVNLVRHAIKEAVDALESLSRPVEGSWVMVPRTVTEPMIEAYAARSRSSRPWVATHSASEAVNAWESLLSAAPVFPTPVMGEEKMREILKAEMSKVDFTLPNRALVDAIMGSALAAMREVAELTGKK